MITYIKLAWRNVWRNKRRSLITISSIFFATFLAIMMRSFQLGSYDNMIYSMIELYSGYIQIEHKDYPDEPSLDNTICYSQELLDDISGVDNIKMVVPRLSSFSLASSNTQTKGVLFLGIDPVMENQMTNLSERVVHVIINENVIKRIEQEDVSEDILKKIEQSKGKYYSNDKVLKFDLGLEDEDDSAIFELIKEVGSCKGEYLSKNDEGVLLGSRLAKYLNLQTGDTLITLGQGYHGASAAGKFLVRGVVKFPNPLMDARIIITSLKTAQNYFSTYELGEDLSDTTFLLTSYAINLYDKKYDDILVTANDIEKVIGDDQIIVRGWKEANKELEQQIRSDNESGQMMVVLLYIVIAFGIFGTILMMTAERKRENAVMIAIGMRRIKLGIIISIEMLFISLTGVLTAMLVSVPIIITGHYHPWRLSGEMANMMENYGMEPVMPLAWFDSYFFNQAMVVFVILLIVMIYPLIALMRMKIIEALHH